LYYLASGVLIVGVTSVARERGRGRVSRQSSSPAPRPPRKALDLPFYRCKESVQMYNGGIAMCYVASGEVPEPCVHGNVAVGEALELCRSTAVGVARILLTFPCFRRGAENHRRHGLMRGTIITCYRGKLDRTPVLFLRSLS
jgi:hypothetical protein